MRAVPPHERPIAVDARKIDLGGTVRAHTAAETLARLQPMLPRFGITRYADVTGLDDIGIPVVMCIRPNSRSIAVSQGKGVTAALASVSAIMESIEVFHAENVEPDLRACTAELTAAGQSWVHPRDLDQARMSNPILAPTRPLQWMFGTDLATDETVAVPLDAVSMNLCESFPCADMLAQNTNGLASGNARDEAILHALCEVVERHSEWTFAHLTSEARLERLVDQHTIDAPVLEQLLAAYAAADVMVAVWDMTTDLGDPAYRCDVFDSNTWRGLSRFHGAGCHPSRTVAMARALTEAAQCRLTAVSGSRDDLLPSAYRTIRDNRRGHGRTPHLRGARSFHATASLDRADSFAGDIHNVVERTRRAGYQRAIAVDLAQPDCDGIAVTKVIIPGMKRGH